MERHTNQIPPNFDDNPPPYNAIYPEPNNDFSKKTNQQEPPPIGFTPSPVVVTRTTVYQQFGEHPMRIICPSCRADIETSIKHNETAMTHLSALLICCFCWPLFWLPYVMDSCKNVEHYCPHCDAYLGKYDR